MRLADETPLDPEIVAQLDAIDATLAGEPVDPEHAELAELALLLRADRPEPRPDFAAALDDRVARRFAEGSPPSRRGSRFTRRWFAPLGGLAAAAMAALVAVLVLGSGGGGSSGAGAGSSSSSGSAAHASARRLSTSAGAAGAASATASGTAKTTANPDVRAASASSTAASPSAGVPAPVPNGRKIIQSAQLSLAAPSNRVETVASEVFGVVGREHVVVNNSSVTSGPGGSAQFQLSVPTPALQTTLNLLSSLRYASVSSRTDATQDVNGQYLSDQRKLNDARALRTSLLKQLASASSQQEIDSLKARIRDAEASIRSDEATLRDLSHRIGFSQVSVMINAQLPVATHHSSSGAFTLGKASHDAGRVLTIAAGVALIALAGLVPVALVGALAWWIAAALRRRRREQALDLA
jgi:hypothetical protein